MAMDTMSRFAVRGVRTPAGAPSVELASNDGVVIGVCIPQDAERPADERAEEVADTPGEAGAEREQKRRQSTLRVAATASS